MFCVVRGEGGLTKCVRPQRQMWLLPRVCAPSGVSLPTSSDWHHLGRLVTSQTQLPVAHLCACILPTGRNTKQKWCDH